VSADVRGNIESAVNQLKDALKGDDGDVIKKSIENLTNVSYKLAEEMYKSKGAQPGGPGPSPAPEAQTDRGTTEKADEDVIDAEFEEKK
jgi:molecular chaperone DnaK